jgi:hypothetical protein
MLLVSILQGIWKDPDLKHPEQKHFRTGVGMTAREETATLPAI